MIFETVYFAFKSLKGYKYLRHVFKLAQVGELSCGARGQICASLVLETSGLGLEDVTSMNCENKKLCTGYKTINRSILLATSST